jgi:hypothetical protein
MALIPGSVRVGGFIAPSDSTDTYATQDAKYGRDGLRSAADNAERNLITDDRRRAGMIVFCRDSSTYFRLLAGPWAYTNADWTELVVTGKPGPSFTFEQATPSALWTIEHNMGCYPAVKVVDSAKTEVTTDVSHPDVNTVLITVAAPFAGTAYLF